MSLFSQTYVLTIKYTSVAGQATIILFRYIVVRKQQVIASHWKHFIRAFFLMAAEKPYDTIPNFTAADALRLTGIGRNEFLDIMNKCRAKV